MRKVLQEMLQTALMALVMFAVLQGTIQNYRVEGSSMEPTLASEQYLLVNKLVYYRIDRARLAHYLPFMKGDPGEVGYLFRPPKEGDIVVFHYPKDPSRDFVKRVIGVPGDTIEVRRGQVYVNGLPLAEPYIRELSRSSMDALVLGPEEYFVLGDNRPHSNDSQTWGPVPMKNIVGSAWVSYWPLSGMRLF